MNAIIRAALVAVLLAAGGVAFAQKPIGTFTPGHTMRANTPSGSYADGGPATGSNKYGQNYLTEIGITNTGLPFCINDSLTSGAYHSFCFGHDDNGNALISVQSMNGAAPGDLICNINGATGPCFGGASGGYTPASLFGIVLDMVATTGITTDAGSTAIGGVVFPSYYSGKSIIIPGVGANGTPLVTTITGTNGIADPAVYKAPDTWFAEPGSNCFVTNPGVGYLPGDSVTLSTDGVCQLQYTEAVNVTLVDNGAGCPNLTGLRGFGSFGYGSPLEISVDISGGSVTSMSVVYPGRYFLVQPGPSSGVSQTTITFEGRTCSVGPPSVTYQQGAGLARITTPGTSVGPPTLPLSQTGTTGIGTGMTASPVYIASGAVWYGTDNRDGLTAAFASTISPTIQFPAGKGLFSCGPTIEAASPISLLGAGKVKTELTLFPYCAQSVALFNWEEANGDGAEVMRMGFDLNRAYVTGTGRAPIVGVRVRGSNHYSFENSSIINAIQLWRSFAAVSRARGMTDLRVVGNYFTFVNPDEMTSNSISVDNSTGSPPGDVDASYIKDNVTVGTGQQLCVVNSLVSGNIQSGWAFGAGIYVPPDRIGQKHCQDSIIALNLSHDGSAAGVDVNETPANGFEIHHTSNLVAVNKSYRNGGFGIVAVGSYQTVMGNDVYNNGRRTSDLNLGSGFVVGSNEIEHADHLSFSFNRGYDSESGSQQYAFSEFGTDTTMFSTTASLNDFAGPAAPANVLIGTHLPSIAISPLMVGGQTLSIPATMAGVPGEFGLARLSAPSGIASGQGTGKFSLVPDTAPGTCKLIFYNGTNTTPFDVKTNMTGC